MILVIGLAEFSVLTLRHGGSSDWGGQLVPSLWALALLAGLPGLSHPASSPWAFLQDVVLFTEKICSKVSPLEALDSQPLGRVWLTDVFCLVVLRLGI